MRAPAIGERWEARRLLALVAAIAVASAMILMYAGTAKAGDGYFLKVDGIKYSPTQISGPVRHYETTDVSPTKAYSDRHKWEGNGSEHLPCPGGIHWIDNSQLLTISNCLDTKSTSSSSSSSSSSTSSAPSTSVPTTTSSSVKNTTSTTTPGKETTTTPDVSESTTTPGEETTTTPGVGESTTTPGEETSTTPGVGESTTTPGEETTTSQGEGSTTTSGEGTTTSEPTDPVPTDSTGSTVPDEVEPTVVTTAPGEVDDDELPFTGLDSEVMVGLAILFLGGGAALLAMTRRVEDN